MTFDIILAVLAVLCLFTGLVGSVVPVLPGPPISYAGLLILSFTRFVDFPTEFLILFAVITAVVTLVDYYLPVLFTKKYGGSRAAAIGSVVGLVAGFFVFPPFGVIFCPFLGALIGELLHDRTDSAKALKVALGTFMAFMLGTGLKLIACGFMLSYGIYALFFS